MKKLLLVALLFMSALVVNAQEFMGIQVAGTASSAIAQFKAKGFTLIEQSEQVAFMKGIGLGGKQLELNIVYSPKTKTVWKYSVYLPEKSSWYSLKSEYKDYLNSLISKYGQPKDSYDFFSNPYEEGDGYEMSAVALDKCVYSAYFNNVSINISKFKQVNIAYENAVNLAISKRERESINQNQL
jgi:hypothetical protein